MLPARMTRPSPPASPKFFRNCQKCSRALLESAETQKSSYAQNGWYRKAVSTQKPARMKAAMRSNTPMTINSGVTPSITIAATSMAVAPGSPPVRVWASELSQCHTLSNALNGNIATRQIRARYHAASARLTVGPCGGVEQGGHCAASIALSGICNRWGNGAP